MKRKDGRYCTTYVYNTVDKETGKLKKSRKYFDFKNKSINVDKAVEFVGNRPTVKPIIKNLYSMRKIQITEAFRTYLSYYFLITHKSEIDVFNTVFDSDEDIQAYDEFMQAYFKDPAASLCVLLLQAKYGQTPRNGS